jgi:uncharacterized membrane protein YcaP (DUF421 family)
MQNSLLEMLIVTIQTVVIYLFLVIGLSLLDRREISQLGLVEIVIIMVLGSAVETSMVAGDTSLPAGLISAATLLVCNIGMTRMLNRWLWLRRIIIGHPIPLVAHGHILPRRAQAARLTDDDILQGIRERGYDSLELVRYAILETDGNISVIPREKKYKRKSNEIN